MILTEAAEAYRKAKQAEVAAVQRESEAVHNREHAQRDSKQAENELLMAATGDCARCARGTPGCCIKGAHVGFSCVVLP